MEERRNQPEFAKSPKKWRYNFSKSLFTFWKTVKMYGGENERIDEEILFFKEVINFFFEEKDEVSILFDGIDIKVDKVRIRGQRQDDKYFEDIYDLFLSLCMAGITIRKGVTDDEILSFFRVIGKFPVGREPKVEAFERVMKDMPELKNISVKAYDPEESGNLPVYTVSESIRRTFRTLASEYLDHKKMTDAVENIPLRTVERSVQDLITMISEIEKQSELDFICALASNQTYKRSFKAASAASRVIYAILISDNLGFNKHEIKRIAISAYFQYLSRSRDKSYLALSRMDEFNYSRIEAALNTSYRITDFSDEGILKKDSSSGTVSGDILKVVSYYDNTTKKWPERVQYNGPTLTRPEALRSILRNVKTGAFKKEIAESIVKVLGVYPVGSILKSIGTDEFVVSGGRFENFSSESTVFVLDSDLSVKEKKTVKAEMLVDIPQTAGKQLPSRTKVEIFSGYLKDTEPE
jgi:hypothetical protein